MWLQGFNKRNSELPAGEYILQGAAHKPWGPGRAKSEGTPGSVSSQVHPKPTSVLLGEFQANPGQETRVL